MFLHLLTEPQQTAFWRAARFLTGVDARYDQREARFLGAAWREMDLLEAPAEAGSLREVLDGVGVFHRKLHANVLMVELCRVALADHAVHPAEREVLEAVMGQLGLTTDRLPDLIDYASRLRAIEDEGHALLKGDASDQGAG